MVVLRPLYVDRDRDPLHTVGLYLDEHGINAFFVLSVISVGDFFLVDGKNKQTGDAQGLLVYKGGGVCYE